jgi:hypothetical protein
MGFHEELKAGDASGSREQPPYRLSRAPQVQLADDAVEERR